MSNATGTLTKIFLRRRESEPPWALQEPPRVSGNSESLAILMHDTMIQKFSEKELFVHVPTGSTYEDVKKIMPGAEENSGGIK